MDYKFNRSLCRTKNAIRIFFKGSEIINGLDKGGFSICRVKRVEISRIVA